MIYNIILYEKWLGDCVFLKYFIGFVDVFMMFLKFVVEEFWGFFSVLVWIFFYLVYDSYGEVFVFVEVCEELKLDLNGCYLFFFGFICDYKGFDLLLEVMVDEWFVVVDVKLILVGEYYSNEVKYEMMIDELGICDCIIFYICFVFNVEVCYFFGVVDLVV